MNNPSANWPYLAALALAVVANLVRRFAPRAHWFHSADGAVVMTLIVGVLGGVGKAIQERGLSWWVVAMAAMSAVGAAVAVSNPSLAAPVPDAGLPLPPEGKPGGA